MKNSKKGSKAAASLKKGKIKAEPVIKEVYMVPIGMLHLPLKALKAFQVFPVQKVKPAVPNRVWFAPCCCCCDDKKTDSPLTITLDYDTQPTGGTYAVVYVAGVGGYSTPNVTFHVKWSASGGSGSLSVEAVLMNPNQTVIKKVSGKGPRDNWSVTIESFQQGDFVFKATVTDSSTNQTSFATLTIPVYIK